MSLSLLNGTGSGSAMIKVASTTNFSGADHSKVSDLLRNTEADFHEKGIDMPPEGTSQEDWLTPNQLGFTSKVGERTILTDALLTQAHTEMGFKAGDYDLTFSNRQRYNEAVKKANSTKLQAAAIFMRQFEKGSEAEILVQPAYKKGSFIEMRELINRNYRPKTLSVIYNHECRNLRDNIANSLKDKPFAIHHAMSKADNDLYEIMDCNIQGDRSRLEFYKLKATVTRLRDWCRNMAVARFRAKNTTALDKFLAQHVYTNMSALRDINLYQLEQIFAHMVTTQDQLEFEAPTKVPSISELKIQLNATQAKLKRANQQVSQFSKRKADIATKATGNAKRSKSNRGVGPCNHCNHASHSADFCWLKEGADHTGRPANWKGPKTRAPSLDINFTEVDEPSLSANVIELTATGGQLSGERNRYIDSCASHIVFNKYAKHLFLTLHSCVIQRISGIGGGVTPTVQAVGEIVFMGTILVAYYAPDIAKSVVAEGWLCKHSNFAINKIGEICTITNMNNNTSLEIIANGTLYTLPDTAFTNF